MCSPNMSPAFPIRSEAASGRRDFTRFGGNRQQRARTGLSPDLGCVGEPSALFTRVTRRGPIVRFSLSLPIEAPLPRARVRANASENKLSIDPEHDTPVALREYARNFGARILLLT